jgi:hypothetical protein
MTILEVRFLTPRAYVSSVNGTRFEVEKDIIAKVEGLEIRVPGKRGKRHGFYTDLDSVPRLPLAYWLTKGRIFIEAILHDYQYFRGDPRDYADAVLLGAMSAPHPDDPTRARVSEPYRSAIYAGVRAGGWKAYNDHRKREAQRPGLQGEST